ncbi:MAG: BrxA family protein [Thermodesulfobacteriota bacterium]
MPERKLSTRLIRKGALIEETYNAFREWDLSKPMRDNLQTIREGNLIGAKSDGWLKEVLATISSRFSGDEEAAPLAILAQRGLDIGVWKCCLLWHIGTVDDLYFRFAADWLMERYREGAYALRSEEVVPFVKTATDGRVASGGRLSEYGALRTARDLLKMAADFGILEGRAKKTFAGFHVPDEALLYGLHALAEKGTGAANMITSPNWRLFLMEPGDVERELFRLHQYRRLDYQVAGSLASLTLPYHTLTDYARSLTT